jgi:RimJ/RimL family protein N-acetyltransferase
MLEAATVIATETERLILRGEMPGDMAVWRDHINTPEVMECLGGLQSESALIEDFTSMREQTQDGPGFHFVALKSDGTLIGKCGLVPIETRSAASPMHGALQIGWTLRADCWGQGYAREAAQAMLAIAFDQYDAPVVYGQTSERNHPSWGLMRRLGMRRVAHLDYPDPNYPPQDNPTMVWRLTRADWQARKANNG